VLAGDWEQSSLDFLEADLMLACDWDGRSEWSILYLVIECYWEKRSSMDFQILLPALSPQGNYLKGPRLFPPLLVSTIMIL